MYPLGPLEAILRGLTLAESQILSLTLVTALPPSLPQLVEVMVDMASNLMLVDEHLLWLAQREDKACSGIVGALERIGGAALSPHAQHISVVP